MKQTVTNLLFEIKRGQSQYNAALSSETALETILNPFYDLKSKERDKHIDAEDFKKLIEAKEILFKMRCDLQQTAYRTAKQIQKAA